MNFTEKSL
jgi:hypothetical protein